MADMQRPSGIGGHKFNLYFLALAVIAGTECFALLQYVINYRVVGNACNEEINESRPRHFNLFDGFVRTQLRNN